MQIITDKDLSENKKPVQVYFEAKVVSMIQNKLNKSKLKLSMAEYIRSLVENDLNLVKKKNNKRKWQSVPLGLNLSSDNKVLDKIIYS